MSLNQLLSSADPALDADIPSGTSAAARWQYHQIVQTESVRSIRRQRARRRGVVGVLAVAAALVALLVVPTGSPPSASASQILRHMAKIANAQPSLIPGPGQYVYQGNASRYQATLYQPSSGSGTLFSLASAQYQETEQSWASAAGSGSGVLGRSGLEFSSGADQVAWQNNSAAQTYLREFQTTVSEPDLSNFAPNVSSLPTDPNALRATLATGTGVSNPAQIPSGTAAVFERAARLLVGPTVGMSPALAAALFQVMADEPDVKLLGPTRDHQGRQGTGVSLPTASGVSEFIFDRQDARALEASFVPPRTTLPAPNNAGGSQEICSPSNACISNLNAQAQIVQSPLWIDDVGSSIVSKNGEMPGTS